MKKQLNFYSLFENPLFSFQLYWNENELCNNAVLQNTLHGNISIPFILLNFYDGRKNVSFMKLWGMFSPSPCDTAYMWHFLESKCKMLFFFSKKSYIEECEIFEDKIGTRVSDAVGGKFFKGFKYAWIEIRWGKSWFNQLCFFWNIIGVSMIVGFIQKSKEFRIALFF